MYCDFVSDQKCAAKRKRQKRAKSHARNSKFDLSLLNVLRFSVRPKLCDKRKMRIQSVPFCSIFACKNFNLIYQQSVFTNTVCIIIVHQRWVTIIILKLTA